MAEVVNVVLMVGVLAVVVAGVLRNPYRLVVTYLSSEYSIPTHLRALSSQPENDNGRRGARGRRRAHCYPGAGSGASGGREMGLGDSSGGDDQRRKLQEQGMYVSMYVCIYANKTLVHVCISVYVCM